MEKSMEVLKKLKIELPYYPGISHVAIIQPCNPTPGHIIYVEKNMVWKDACTPMFIAALFTIAKTWKQPKCPLTEEWIRKMWYIYTMEYYSSITKNKIMSFAAMWMDLQMIILSKSKTNTISSHLHVESKTHHKWTRLWNRNRLTDIENRSVVDKREVGRRRDGLGV